MYTYKCMCEKNTSLSLNPHQLLLTELYYDLANCFIYQALFAFAHTSIGFLYTLAERQQLRKQQLL